MEWRKILESTPPHLNQNKGEAFLMVNNKKYKKGQAIIYFSFSLPFFL
jgi:hypothetical protein